MFRTRTIVLLMIMLAWTLSDLFSTPAGRFPDFNSAFVIIYFALIALCYLRISWGFLGTIALSIFRILTELPVLAPLPEHGVFFTFPWSGAVLGVLLYLTRFSLQTALGYIAYRGYDACRHLVLD